MGTYATRGIGRFPYVGIARHGVGALVLVSSVRVVDALWRRIFQRLTPVEAIVDLENIDSSDPRVVHDRLVYALLLVGALRLASRAGWREQNRSSKR